MVVLRDLAGIGTCWGPRRLWLIPVSDPDFDDMDGLDGGDVPAFA
jgi:hypothetical protein